MEIVIYRVIQHRKLQLEKKHPISLCVALLMPAWSPEVTCGFIRWSISRCFMSSVCMRFCYLLAVCHIGERGMMMVVVHHGEHCQGLWWFPLNSITSKVADVCCVQRGTSYKVLFSLGLKTWTSVSFSCMSLEESRIGPYMESSFYEELIYWRCVVFWVVTPYGFVGGYVPTFRRNTLHLSSRCIPACWRNILSPYSWENSHKSIRRHSPEAEHRNLRCHGNLRCVEFYVMTVDSGPRGFQGKCQSWVFLWEMRCGMFCFWKHSC